MSTLNLGISILPDQNPKYLNPEKNYFKFKHYEKFKKSPLPAEKAYGGTRGRKFFFLVS